MTDFSCPYCPFGSDDPAEYIRHTVSHAYSGPALVLAFNNALEEVIRDFEASDTAKPRK